jgi:formate C-acetyltransferase
MSTITIRDLSLRDVKLTPQLEALRAAYFQAVPEICSERPVLLTKFSRQAGLLGRDRITPLEKGQLYRKVLENRLPVVWHTKAHKRNAQGMEEFFFDDGSPFAGSTTSKFKGVPMYPEFMALSLWPELCTLSRRKSNPYYISNEDVRKLNFEVFPYWINDNIVELARVRGNDADRNRIQLLQKFVLFLASKPNCISHTIPDFSRAVKEGLRAIIDDAQTRRNRTQDGPRKDFYQAIVEVMNGIIAYARNLADAAAALAERESDAAKKTRLADMARIYRRVPENPAESFREGLTTIWVCWTAIHLENANVGLSLGRLDQVLYNLYDRDIQSKRMSVAEAVELLGYLWLKIGDHVPMIPSAGEQLFGGTGSNQAITIGGMDAEGRDAANDLTYVMLRATELMMLRDPNLNARYHPEVNNDAYLRRLCEANLNTRATPALHNDRAVIRALTESGHTLAQARDYGVIGCVEPGSNGRFYGHSGALLLNLPSALELALFNGRHRHFGMETVVSQETGDPVTFTSFEQFREAVKKQMLWLVDQAIALNELLGRIHQCIYPTPILSALFEGPMEKGKDLIEGGATINASGIAIIGLADVADSLNAIETTVYRERQIRFPDFIDALQKNYEGFEWLLRRLRDPQRTPRFGNDEANADGNALWLVETLHEAVKHRRNYRGGNYRVGYWTMTNHAGFGRLIGATPNGRKAGENFSSGLTPNSGVTPYLTAALHSVAKLPPQFVGNGMAVNLKFNPDDADAEKMLERFVAYVKGYFDATEDQPSGGMEIQFNVTSHQDFVNAVNDPSQYDKLLVRVSGYTAYFKDLNPQMQKEIIDRTEYCLSTGRAVYYEPFPLPEGGDHGHDH